MTFENYIINPLNNRLIRRELCLYRKLVKNGVISHDYDNDKNILCVIDEESDIEGLKELYNEKMENHRAVIGRGMYKNYLVKKKIKSKHKKLDNKKIDYIIKQTKIKIENDEEEIEDKIKENLNNKYKNNGKKYYIEL